MNDLIATETITTPAQDADNAPVDAEPEAPAPDPRIAELEAKLTAANTEIALLREQLQETSAKVFRRGQEIAALEKARVTAADRLDHAERASHAAIDHAEALAQTAAELKEREMRANARADALQRQVSALEARLAAAKEDIEFDIILNASADDLRIVELAGWTIRHMQFEGGSLNVVIRRIRQRPHPKDRKPRAFAHRHVPVAPPAAPAQPTAGTDRPADVGEMVVIGLGCDADPRPTTPDPIRMVIDSFTRNLHEHMAANPIPAFRPFPLSTEVN